MAGILWKQITEESVEKRPNHFSFLFFFPLCNMYLEDLGTGIYLHQQVLGCLRQIPCK